MQVISETDVTVETPKLAPPTEPAPLDDAVRALVREEIMRASGLLPPKDTDTPSLREAVLLLLLCLDAGLLLALWSELTDYLGPIWNAFVSIGTAILTLGYAWFRTQALAKMRSRAALPCAASFVVVLALAHVVIRIPLVPLYTEPTNARLVVDGQSKTAQRPALVTLASHSVEIGPQTAWLENDTPPRARAVSVGKWDAVRAALRIGKPLTWALLCPTFVQVPPKHIGAALEIQRQSPFDEDYLRLLRDEPDQGVVVHASADTVFFGMHIAGELRSDAEVPLPVGVYKFSVQSGNCRAVRQDIAVQANACASVKFEQLSCPS